MLLFPPCYRWTITELELNNNHSPFDLRTLYIFIRWLIYYSLVDWVAQGYMHSMVVTCLRRLYTNVLIQFLKNPLLSKSALRRWWLCKKSEYKLQARNINSIQRSDWYMPIKVSLAWNDCNIYILQWLYDMENHLYTMHTV
jgi:hypothetical protein